MENSETGYKNLLPTHKRIKIEFLKTGKIFTDDEFPAADKSLFILNDNKTKKNTVKWMRVKDLCTNPTFFEDLVNKDLENSKFGNINLLDILNNNF